MTISFRNISRLIFCVILALIMALLGTVRTFAYSYNRDAMLDNYSPEQIESMVSFSEREDDGKIEATASVNRLYISEVVIETGKRVSDVKKALHDKGYCVYDQNLNEGAGGYNENLCSYIGYKVTFDKNKAITDLRLMDQDGGYDDFNYKAYIQGSMPGLAPTAQAMMNACVELKSNIEKKKTNALTAKEVLNSFCVPKTSSELDGTPLCDYLIDPARKLEDYEELLIVLNSSVLDVINFQLAFGNVDSKLIETEIGSTGIISHSGVVDYSGMTDKGNWIADSVKKLSDAGGYETIKKKAGLLDDYYDQIYLLRKAFDKNSDAPFTAKAEEWLKSVYVGYKFDPAADKLVADDAVSAYELLSDAPDLFLAALCSVLPEVCYAGHFKDVVEICANDSTHRLPSKLEYQYKYNTDWMNNVIAAIDSLNFDPYDEKSHTEHYHEVTRYSEDISRLFSALENYYAGYEKAVEKLKKNGVKDTSADAMQEGEIFSDILSGNHDYEDNTEVLYAGTYSLLEGYSLKSSKTPTFASYIKQIVTLMREKSDKNDNEWIAMALAYPIISGLSLGQRFSIMTTPLVTFFAGITADETTSAVIRMQLPAQKAALLEGINAERLSVWFGTNKDLIESETVSMTSQNVRRAIESGNFSAATSKDFTLTDKRLHLLVWFSVGTVILAGAVSIFLIVLTSFLPVSLTLVAVFHIGIFGLFSITAFSAAITAMCIIAVVAVVVLVVLVVVCLVFLILYLVEKYKKKKPVYSTIPSVMLDCIENENNKVIEAVRYDAVLDQTGMPGDINCKQGVKWLALYYTTDPDVGSPLTCKTVGSGIDLSAETGASAARLQEIGEKCSFFGCVKGTTSSDDKCETLAKFGQSGHYNLNANCFDDDVNGLYVWFYTVDSLAGISKSKYEKKYISDITVAISKKDKNISDPARNYILSMKGYFLLDVDLAPSNADFAVYIGYSTTDLEEEALRDIRVAYANNAPTITYGEATYINALPGGLRYVPMKTCEQSDASRTVTPFSFQLFETKTLGRGDSSAPPILAGSLKVADSISAIPDGCEPIALFGGAAYDFDTWDGESEATHILLDKSESVYDRHRFVYYSTERPYKSTDKNAIEYLAGVSFFSGSTDQGIAVMVYRNQLTPGSAIGPNQYDVVQIKEQTHIEYAKALGYKLLDYDLTCGILCDEEDTTYMAYCTTYNPYRAITDMGVFTSEPKSGYCPDNLISGGVGFESCAVFTQGDYYYYKGAGNSNMRQMRLTHGYFTSVEEEGKHNGWKGDPILCSRAMYTAGYRTGINPLKPSDIVISIKDDVIPTATGTNSSLYFLDDFNSRRPVGAGLGRNWKTVHPLDQYFYDCYLASGDLASCFNVGLGVKGTRKSEDTSVFNIFLRNESIPNRVRGNYVGSASIVSSLDANSSYDSARMSAMMLGEEIIGLDSPIRLSSSMFPDLLREQALYPDDDSNRNVGRYGDGCFLLAVSYTNSISSALGDIRIMQKAEGTTFPINISKPLDDYGTVTYYYGNVAQLTGPGEFDEKDETGRIRTAAEKAAIKEKKPAITLYTTPSGMKINRLLIQQIPYLGFISDDCIWHDNPNGAGDYYIKDANSDEAFCFLGYGSGIESYICARRYDTGKEANYQYISDIVIVKTDLSDSSFRKAAIELGSAGYPFIIEYDLAEKTIGAVADNKSLIIGTARTGSASHAIKDIKFSYDDYGPTYIYHKVSYRRANSEPLHFAGMGNTDIYVYFTRETGDEDVYTGVKITWQELKADKKTDWANVDWTKVDINTIVYSEFSRAIHTPLNSKSWETYTRVTSIVRPGVDPLMYSIKNIGIIPGAENRIIWAGASENGVYRKNDTNPASTLIDIATFDGSAPPVRLMLKNEAGKSFDQGLEEYYAFLGKKRSASVFANLDNPAVWTVVGVIALIAIAIPVAVSRKNKKQK